MGWDAASPDGTRSVKFNRTQMNANNSYIETTMGNSIVGTNNATVRDHFWDVGVNEDGRHRFMQSPAFTVGSVPTDPVVGTGMDAVLYLKTINDLPQWFTRTSVVTGGIIYQVTPGYLTGTKTVTSSYTNLVAVPANTWGEIFMWRNTQGENTAQTGFFRSNGTTVEAWALYLAPEGSSESINLKFGNGSDVGIGINALNIQVRTADAASGSSWNYRVTHRAI